MSAQSAPGLYKTPTAPQRMCSSSIVPAVVMTRQLGDERMPDRPA